MRIWPLVLAIVLLGLLGWVLWPNAAGQPIKVETGQLDSPPEDRSSVNPELDLVQQTPQETTRADPPEGAPDTSAATAREQASTELDVRGRVNSALSEPLFARLVYVTQGEMEGADWFHHPGLAWTKPRPVEADGSFHFRGPYADSFDAYDWRVEIGVPARDGDEFRGSTPLLTLGTSDHFSIERHVPVELAAIDVFEAIELVVPLHDWHLIPCEDLILSGEFDQQPAIWHGKPTAWFKPSDGARISKSIRLSPWHRGRAFRVFAHGDDPSLDDPAYGEWITLQPGRHGLAALRPIPSGMLEIFFPNSRALFPHKEGGAGWNGMTEVRLGRFDAKRRTSFEQRFMIDPGASLEVYDPSWGLAPDPGGAWQGDTYISRVGWIEAGTWNLAIESTAHGPIAEPIAIEIAPFDVTRITVKLLDQGQKIHVIPVPAGSDFDDYVLSTWATIATGKAHVYRFALDIQQPRDLRVPPGSRSVASVSHWHGEPAFEGGPSSRLSYFRGEMSTLRKPSEKQLETQPNALPELTLHRGETSLVLEFPLDTSIKGYHMGEIQGLSGQLDGHAITFTVNPGRAIELRGFPPGHYDIRLAPNQPNVTATEFMAWRTIQIQEVPR